MLSEEDIEEALLEECRIFHFGSLSMTNRDEGNKGDRTCQEEWGSYII